MATIKDIEQIVKRPDELLTIKENATIAEAARKMRDAHVGCLVVFDVTDKFAGILTERDMLAKVLATSLPPESVFARDIMTTEAISCRMDTTITRAEQIMAEHKIRHLPIVEDGIPVGMVSSRDVIAHRLQSNKAMKAAAEQLAILSAKLKFRNFNDVISMVTNEVPKSFEADWAVMYFTQKDSSDSMLYRKGCPLSEKAMPKPKKIIELSQNGWVICGKICDDCKKLGGRAPRVVIPLSICEQSDEYGDIGVNMQGFLCMCQFNPYSSSSEELQLYKASLLQEILSVNLTNAKLYENYQKARRDSEIDPLTGIGTRRMLEEVLRSEYARAIRYNSCFSVAIIDVDNLKQVNDNTGHAAGDRVLQQLAKVMQDNIRTTDILARYGGDEFVLLMPETKLNEATELLERLRGQVKGISIPNVQPITISCGVAEWNQSPADTTESMLKRADAAMYEAKHNGRDRVVAGRAAAKTI